MPSRVNIKSGGTTPTGTINITENGQYDVTDYANADVNVIDDRVDKLIDGTITDIYSNVTKMRQYAFCNCPDLKTVILPQTSNLGSFAFDGSTKLEKLICPKLTSLGTFCLRGTTNLKVLDLPIITSISGYECFRNSGLQHLILRTTNNCSLSDRAVFSGTPFRNGIGGTLYINYANVSWYQTATNWSALESTTFTSIQENLVTLQSLGVDITPYYEIVTELPTTDISTTKVYLIETSTTGTYEQHYYNGTSWSTNLPDIML